MTAGRGSGGDDTGVTAGRGSRGDDAGVLAGAVLVMMQELRLAEQWW